MNLLQSEAVQRGDQLCLRAIKTMLFIIACAAALIFTASRASAKPPQFSNAEVLKSPNANPIAVAHGSDPGILFLLGTGLVLTGTALRRKERAAE